jgi:hypothetical protein
MPVLPPPSSIRFFLLVRDVVVCIPEPKNAAGLKEFLMKRRRRVRLTKQRGAQKCTTSKDERRDMLILLPSFLPSSISHFFSRCLRCWQEIGICRRRCYGRRSIRPLLEFLLARTEPAAAAAGFFEKSRLRLDMRCRVVRWTNADLSLPAECVTCVSHENDYLTCGNPERENEREMGACLRFSCVLRGLNHFSSDG